MQLARIPKLDSYKELAYAEIKAAIVTQRVRAGAPLNERTLAEQLGVSRTPVREALRLLENEGLVVIEPGRGTWVKAFAVKDIVEIYQMRLALESLAAELIVQHFDKRVEAALAELLRQQEAMTGQTAAAAFVDSDIALHMGLARLSGSKVLYQTMSRLMGIVNVFLLRAVWTGQRAAAQDGHREIVAALLARKLPETKRSIVRHLERAYAAAAEEAAAGDG